MARVRKRLSKAPITEAVLDFRARLPAEVQLETLKTALSELARTYPNVEDAWLIEGSFEFSSQPVRTASTSSRKANGFFARTQDGKQVAQLRLDGFTFSRLAPYTSWEEIVPEAFRLWEIYRVVARPSALYRVAVRYINHIPLPAPTVELNDLLAFAPQVPQGLPQVLDGFLTRVVVPLSVPNTRTSIVQAYNAPPAATSNALLLDVDVFRTGELELEVERLRPVFDQLRIFKNQAFFGSLTETMVEMLE